MDTNIVNTETKTKFNEFVEGFTNSINNQLNNGFVERTPA